MSKKKAPPPRKLTTLMPAALIAGLRNADALAEQKRYDEAQALLEELIKRYPTQQEPLRSLVNVAYDTHNMALYEAACAPLVKLSPRDADLTLALAGAYLNNGRYALTAQTARRFLEMAPGHERAEEARKLLQTVEAELPAYLAGTKLDGPDGVGLAALFEQAQSLLERGEYRAMRQEAQKLLARRADHPATLNNISQSYFAEGDIDQAIVTARSVLDVEPENIHALANLTHYAVITGYWDEAQEFAADLKASKAPAYQKQVKIAEALSYLGDYAGVLEAFEQAQAQEATDEPYHSALLLHLAGAAAARLGQTDKAKQYWKRALAVQPGFELASGNIADLNAPVEERHGAWAFSLPTWLLATAQSDLRARVMQISAQSDEDTIAATVRAFFKQRPEVAALVPTLLERGDPAARQMALLLARSADTPDMLDALKAFALGQNGPDALRLQAFETVSQARVLPPGSARLWLGGAWQDVMPMNFEITDEPEITHAPEIQQLINDGIEAMHDGDLTRAEALYQQALEQDADSPMILNNLAAIFSQQGRDEEYKEIIRYVHEHYPDYFAGRTNMAMLLARENKIEEARDMLAPLQERRKVHTSEFSLLCMARIEVQLAAEEPEDARRWLEMWEQVVPDHRNLEIFRGMIENAVLSADLQKMLQNRKTRGRKKPVIKA